MPPISWIREPIAAPNTTKYSDVEITGEMMLCISVRRVRAISNRVDRADRVQVHRSSLTRLTKMSSSELCVVWRSLKRMPASSSSFSSAAIRVRSPSAS